MKRDLYFNKPQMNAAGSLGFTPDPRAGIPLESFGAFVTNPVSLRPRAPAAQPVLMEYPGGFLLHTGLPNAGFFSVINSHRANWDRSPLPVIVHLMADRPEETRHMIQMLEGIENVMAVELGFAPLLSDDIIYINLEMCRGELPLIFSLPVDQVLTLGPRLVQQGAAAISIAAPRGAMTGENGHLVRGRLFGPSLLPRMLETVHSAGILQIPIIAGGGIWHRQDIAAMLAAGAMAVQVDASLWLPGISL
jgi:dihydroorotate dehydrogenase (NAD+) catalytic subunit